jgi:hypothetical protein
MSDRFTIAATQVLWAVNAALAGWLIGRFIVRTIEWLAIYGTP